MVKRAAQFLEGIGHPEGAELPLVGGLVDGDGRLPDGQFRGEDVLNGEPGEGQKFTVLHLQGQGDLLALKAPHLGKMATVVQPVQAERTPHPGNARQCQQQGAVVVKKRLPVISPTPRIARASSSQASLNWLSWFPPCRP